VSLAANKFAKTIETKAQRDATRNLYGPREQYETGIRKMRALQALKRVSVAGIVSSVGAVFFQGTANVYCAIQCPRK